MTRIIAGVHRGRVIKVPDAGTRPTAERVREAVFSSLISLDAVSEIHVLDLYAGSGALGIEALSRGALSCLFVDNNINAINVINKNVADLKINAHVVEVKVETLLTNPPASKFKMPAQLIFLDPPYEMTFENIYKVLTLGLTNSWFSPSAILVVETAKRSGDFVWPVGFESLRDKKYGDTRVWYGQVCKK
jgi:16S rRNA (guanine966-N2)-methyltransferase